MEKSQACGYMCGAINTMEDVFDDPHLAARGFFAEIDHPHTGALKYPGAQFKMSETPWRAGRAPLLGEHTQEVLSSVLGYRDDEHRRVTPARSHLMPKLPLEGVRVIDMTVVWAGPFGGALLGDLGAEVIKIDSTQRLDPNSRGQNFTIEQLRENGHNDVSPDARPYNLSANFNSVGRNKKSVTMDLLRPEGQRGLLPPRR